MHHAAPARLRPYERLHIVPVILRAARAYVTAAHHPHRRAPIGAKLAISVHDQRGTLRGVAILGRPLARRLDDGKAIEVTRVATDGCRNACSALYGAARRVARALDYARIYTSTRETEPGTSLRAVGWRAAARSRGGGWSRDSRRKRDRHPLDAKVRWEVTLASTDERA